VSDSPAPDAPKPDAPQPELTPTRRRRLWRRFKKWTRRTLLLALVLLAAFSVWYPIHRALAYRAGDRAVEAVRAELDATEPGWRYEDIQAKYNASLPPPDRNSFRWLERVPELGTTDEEREEFRQLVLDAELDSIATDAQNRTLTGFRAARLRKCCARRAGQYPKATPPSPHSRASAAAALPCPPNRPWSQAIGSRRAWQKAFPPGWASRASTPHSRAITRPP
jgi:hypothetical protein